MTLTTNLTATTKVNKGQPLPKLCLGSFCFTCLSASNLDSDCAVYADRAVCSPDNYAREGWEFPEN